MTAAYIVIQARAWMNERGYGFDYTSDLERFDDRSDAISHGFTLTDSDDFNIGTLDGDRLVAVGWMCKDFAPEDSALGAAARQLGLKRSVPVERAR